MKAPDLEREQVLDYFAAQMADDPVVHLEKVAVERVGSVLHDIWDVHCRGSRWWAISNSLNYYSQEDFTSRDDVNWRKHTLARLDEAGNVSLSYRPVHTETLLSYAEGGIDPKKIAPKARVY